MTEFTNASFHRSSKHRGEHGNAVINCLEVVIPPRAVAGDTIVVDTGPFESKYISMLLARGAMTAGLLVDVGVRECNTDVGQPTFFGAGVNTTAPGRDELIDAMPLQPLNAALMPIEHEVYVTLKGTVTPGETFALIVTALYGGAPTG